MNDPKADKPIYFWERTKIGIEELTDQEHQSFRLLTVQLSMRRVPPIPGQEGMETRPPSMYLHIDAARELAALLLRAVEKAESTPSAPTTRQ